MKRKKESKNEITDGTSESPNCLVAYWTPPVQVSSPKARSE